ncbi:hypothetical protein [uncultured Fusobacterium sp.]|uniref:hypothetical protein n=1 Tax=uncultured Fusobacterium sp. TaxID=159267 RepID=UPI0025FE2AEC|nr:hypothetical protein [uncultured Fusobacterium sp.]
MEVIAINPDQKTLQKIIGKEVEPPIYVRTQQFPDGEKDTVDIVFWLKIKDAVARERVVRLQQTIVKSSWTSKTSGKVQVLNIFGHSTWITPAELKAKDTSAYPWFRPEGLRLAYRGEASVVETISNWFNLPQPGKVEKDLTQAYCQIEDVPALFKGNFKELHQLVKLAEGKEQTFKVLCGVREGKDGKMFQTVYNRSTLRNWITDYSKLASDISDISNAFYGENPFELKEYRVETTEPAKPQEVEEKKSEDPYDDDLPF